MHGKWGKADTSKKFWCYKQRGIYDGKLKKMPTVRLPLIVWGGTCQRLSKASLLSCLTPCELRPGLQLT